MINLKGTLRSARGREGLSRGSTRSCPLCDAEHCAPGDRGEHPLGTVNKLAKRNGVTNAANADKADKAESG